MNSGVIPDPNETLAERIARIPIEDLRRNYQHALEDWADDDSRVKELAARVLPHDFEDNGYGFVGVVDVTEMLVVEIERLRALP